MSHFLGMLRGYGLGALSDDMYAFNGTVGGGDTYLNAGEWQSAVTAYQSAGSIGATTIGPEVDQFTGGASIPLTQQAWAINGNLASINNTSTATQSDAVNAQGFVRQMQNLYTTAMGGGGGGGGGNPSPGAGIAPSSALVATANALVSYLQTSGCTTSSVSQVTAFQTSYNAEGSVSLAVDGKYGPQTQGALQRVLTASGGGSAPQNCFTSSGGGVSPPSSGGGGGPMVAPAQAGTMNWGMAALVAGAVVGAGYIAYEMSHGRHPLRRAGHRMGHHARRLHRGLRHRLLRRRHA